MRFSKAGVVVLIAPLHGCDSDRHYGFLDIVNVKPGLTLSGNAPSEHLAHGDWNARDLLFATSNQAGTIILHVDDNRLVLDVSHELFARAFVESRCYDTHDSDENRGWLIRVLN